MTENLDLKIAYIASNAFAEQCAVSLASLFENNKEFHSISVCIIEDHFSERNKERLLQLAQKFSRQVQFAVMPEPAEYFGSPLFSVHNVGHTFARMILGDLLPADWSKVICLDSDMLVLGSLTELWNTDISEYYIAGVENGVGDKVMTRMLGVRPGTLYCNSGLGYVNLDAVRRDGIEEKYVDYMKRIFQKGGRLSAYEEEVINKCCYPRILRLDYKYNVMSINLVMDYDEFMEFRGAGHFYSREEVEEAVKDPVIVHSANLFYTKKRMWEKDSDAPYTEEYFKYRKMTGWAEEPAIKGNRNTKQRFMKGIWHVLPRRAAFRLASFVRNEVRPLLVKQRDDE